MLGVHDYLNVYTDITSNLYVIIILLSEQETKMNENF